MPDYARLPGICWGLAWRETQWNPSLGRYAPREGRLAVCGEPERSDVTNPMDSHNDERSGRDHYDGAASAALVHGREAADRCCVVGTGCGGIRSRPRSGIHVSQLFRWRQELCQRDETAAATFAAFGASRAASARVIWAQVCRRKCPAPGPQNLLSRLASRHWLESLSPRRVVSSEVYLTSQEAAQYLHTSPSTLAKLRVYGGGPSFCRIGRAIRYRRSDLDEFMARGRVRSTSETARPGGSNE